jgi:hypothetical protein
MTVNSLNVNANGNGHSVGYFRTECECECEFKISKTTHSPNQLSQIPLKTSFIPSLFYNQDYITKKILLQLLLSS